ncbi:MAG TPA: 3-deoxy-manno-octulosonate cytidylyltransferase [Pyrinomonadaceae bacterium]|nr:3-deoxy-manno-octulosonate cytidylyltransferase [Pyrinomonadaceae bacterium]
MNQTGDNPQNVPKHTTVAIIPARFASTRLPGKALIEIAGKPMVCWVAECALAARNVDRVIVATDSEKIIKAVRARGIEVMLTSSQHTSGTDRVAEVAAAIPEAEIIVNVQGDEPLISPQTIERAVDVMQTEMQKPNGGAGIVTTWEPIEASAYLFDPDLVKVVLDNDDNAIYFSRSPVPFPRDAAKRHGSPEAALEEEPDLLKLFRKHTGLYVYRRDVLLEFTKWPQTQLEQIEALEQLRALAHGVKIKVVEACSTSIGVDTLVDLERVRSTISEPGSRTGATNA